MTIPMARWYTFTIMTFYRETLNQSVPSSCLRTIEIVLEICHVPIKLQEEEQQQQYQYHNISDGG